MGQGRRRRITILLVRNVADVDVNLRTLEHAEVGEGVTAIDTEGGVARCPYIVGQRRGLTASCTCLDAGPERTFLIFGRHAHLLARGVDHFLAFGRQVNPGACLQIVLDFAVAETIRTVERETVHRHVTHFDFKALVADLADVGIRADVGDLIEGGCLAIAEVDGEDREGGDELAVLVTVADVGVVRRFFLDIAAQAGHAVGQDDVRANVREHEVRRRLHVLGDRCEELVVRGQAETRAQLWQDILVGALDAVGRVLVAFAGIVDEVARDMRGAHADVDLHAVVHEGHGVLQEQLLGGRNRAPVAALERRAVGAQYLAILQIEVDWLAGFGHWHHRAGLLVTSALDPEAAENFVVAQGPVQRRGNARTEGLGDRAVGHDHGIEGIAVAVQVARARVAVGDRVMEASRLGLAALLQAAGAEAVPHVRQDFQVEVFRQAHLGGGRKDRVLERVYCQLIVVWRDDRVGLSRSADRGHVAWEGFGEVVVVALGINLRQRQIVDIVV